MGKWLLLSECLRETTTVQPEEQSMTDMLMRVFTLSIPFMPKTATTFAMDLTKALLPMINKPLRGTAVSLECYAYEVRLDRFATGPT